MSVFKKTEKENILGKCLCKIKGINLSYLESLLILNVPTDSG